MVSQFAQNEQNMNAVERVLHYTELEPEGATNTPSDPPAEWPSKGGLSFKNVELAYRPGLPLVLKDISFEVHPGEKVCLKNSGHMCFCRNSIKLRRLASLAVPERAKAPYYKHSSGIHIFQLDSLVY